MYAQVVNNTATAEISRCCDANDACAGPFFSLIQPIKFSVFGVVIVVPVVDHEAPYAFLQKRAQRVPGAGAWPCEGRMVGAFSIVVISTTMTNK